MRYSLTADVFEIMIFERFWESNPTWMVSSIAPDYRKLAHCPPMLSLAEPAAGK
jgi:hypothetical protein